MQRFDGPGTAFVALDGEVVEYTLNPGERLKVDTGHVALFKLSVELVKGFKNILFCGEGCSSPRSPALAASGCRACRCPSWPARLLNTCPPPKAANKGCWADKRRAEVRCLVSLCARCWLQMADWPSLRITLDQTQRLARR